MIAIPAAIVSSLLLAKLGKYKYLQVFGLGVCTLGLGLFVTFDQHTHSYEWILFQGIGALGSGFVLNTLLPACQVVLPESDQAAVTATWSFVRALGNVWGVALPAVIFNNRIDQLKADITDPDVRGAFENGNAYERATESFISQLSESTGTRDQVVHIYTKSLQRVWQFCTAASGLAFLLVLLEDQVRLRTELDTDYGLKSGIARPKEANKPGE